MQTHLNGVDIVTNNDVVTFTKSCSVTKEIYSIAVDAERYNKWLNGELIQNVFPDLTEDQREFMISGFTPAEWERLF